MTIPVCPRLPLREWVKKWKADQFPPGVAGMLEAGWTDWSCDHRELRIRLHKMLPMLWAAAESPLAPHCYFLFTNIALGHGSTGQTYDRFSLVDIQSGNTLIQATAGIHANGHSRGTRAEVVVFNKKLGYAHVWGRKKTVVIQYFQKLTEQRVEFLLRNL